MAIIREGMEWQVRELSEAALEISREMSDGAHPHHDSGDAAYAQGVGEVLRLLIADDMDAALRDSEDTLNLINERYRENV